MKRNILLAVLLAGAWWLAGCQGAEQPGPAGNVDSKPAAAQETQRFPDFTVRTLDGQNAELKQYRGKIVILDLFATWCPPCRMEIPHFVELQQEHRDVMAVVGLSFDQAPAEQVKAFAQELKINYDLYWGSEEIARYVGLRGIPHTLVLDQEGRIYKSYVGYRDKSVFEADIAALKAKPGQL
ncbi:MAG: redoxin domain-containing protein [candidate division FCPU426 bacterium]